MTRQRHTICNYYDIDTQYASLRSSAFLSQHPVETVRRLAQFLGVEASDQLCQDIADACSFQKMKQADKDKTSPQGTIFPMELQMYRKGEVVPSSPGFTRIPAT